MRVGMVEASGLNKQETGEGDLQTTRRHVREAGSGNRRARGWQMVFACCEDHP